VERSIAALGLAIALFLLIALTGFHRIRRLRDVLDPDGLILAEFAAALRAFQASAGHDMKALQSLLALAPDVEPLVDASPRDVLFEGLESLPRAYDDPAGNPQAGAERTRLASMQAQVEGAERLLEGERARIANREGSLRAWLYEGAAGAVLVAWATGGEARLAARTRRRRLEADPRFRWTVRALLVLALLAGLVLAFAGLWTLATRRFPPPSGA
jgi:hypothetical protein